MSPRPKGGGGENLKQDVTRGADVWAATEDGVRYISAKAIRGNAKLVKFCTMKL